MRYLPKPHAAGTTPGDGFTAVELLVSLVLGLMVFGAALRLLAIHQDLALSQPQAADLQQRARVAALILSTDLATAGAWTDRGGLADGLGCCIPVLHPRRLGTRAADPPGTARDDAVTIVRVSQGGVAGRLRDALIGGVLTLEAGNGCVASRPLCGFQEDDHVIVFEPAGRHDFFVLGPPAADSVPVRSLRQPSPAHQFDAGSVAAVVETTTYGFDRAARQLRRYDGYQSDVPVVDDVLEVRFEYWGAEAVPARARMAAGVGTCWTDSAGEPRFGRPVATPGAADVPLPLEVFRDGPWCGNGDNRFDADLLRIRRIRAVLRFAATSSMARGTGGRFALPGRANRAAALVPDMEVSIDVAPRGLTTDY